MLAAVTAGSWNVVSTSPSFPRRHQYTLLSSSLDGYHVTFPRGSSCGHRAVSKRALRFSACTKTRVTPNLMQLHLSETTGCDHENYLQVVDWQVSRAKWRGRHGVPRPWSLAEHQLQL